MDKETMRFIKLEQNDEQVNGDSIAGQSFDYNRLYGELYNKLLSTPVGEIFPEGTTRLPPGRPSSSSTQLTSSPSTSNNQPVHSAFPVFGVRELAQTRLIEAHTFQDGHALDSPNVKRTNPFKDIKTENGDTSFISSNMDSILPGDFSPGEQMELQDIEAMRRIYAGLDQQFGIHDNIDITRLVEEFRVTLEKYGVSQRFAARFIMQDTSQGNLSFLMEKGRSKKWAELSPRGRIPYIKMKAWLESKEQQMMTLEMLKHSQDVRKSSPRETYSRRERFSMFQLNVLCRLFEENPNPPMNVRNAVAERLNIPLDRVNVWFQNQRARGFPARKILQQSFYNESPVSPNTDIVNDSQFSSGEIKLTSATCTNEMMSNINRHTSVRNGDPLNNISSIFVNSSDICQTNLSASNSVGRAPPREHLVLPVSYAYDQTSLSNTALPVLCRMPLDLRATKKEDNNVSAMFSSPPRTSADVKQDMNGSYITDTGSAQLTAKNGTQSESLKTSNQSGAAKRKRGIKPQHIVPSKIEEITTQEAGNPMYGELTTKRQRLEDIYGAFQLTTDLNKSEYKYTITTDTDYNTEHNTSLNMLEPSGARSNAKDKAQLKKANNIYKAPSSFSSGEKEIVTAKSTRRKDCAQNIPTPLANSIPLTKDKLEVFKSICANIFMHDKDNAKVEEPELD